MLHTVNKSPYEKNSLQRCLQFATDGSPVLLIENGVYAVLAAGSQAAMVEKAISQRQLRVYALGVDLKLRGIDQQQMIAGIQVVDYPGFVNLAVENDKVQSWL